MKFWILVGQTPIECEMVEWAEWFDAGKNKLRSSRVGEWIVSTVFVGYDMSLTGTEELPVVFETMAFGLDDAPAMPEGTWQVRDRAYPWAMESHEQMVFALREYLK